MIDFLLYYRGLAQHLVIFGLTIYAFRRGAWPERSAGAILTAMVLLDYLYHALFPQGGVYRTVNYGHAIIDLFVVVAIAVLAARANRIYPIWMLAAQLISFLMHFNREISSAIHPMVYLILTRAPSYVQIIAFAGGLWMHRRRVQKFGIYRSWRKS